MTDEIRDEPQENSEAEGETSPYDEIIRGADTLEEALRHTIRDRGRMVWMMFVILILVSTANIYQLTIPKNIPFIHNVDSNGTVVTRILRRPEEISSDDPGRRAFIKRAIQDWIQGARTRSIDRNLMSAGINTALRLSAGVVGVNLSNEIRKEDVFKRVTREKVYVNMPKLPVPLAGDTWQAEWEEEVRGAENNMEIRRENWSGSFQIAAQDAWVTDLNIYGIRVIDAHPAPLSK